MRQHLFYMLAGLPCPTYQTDQQSPSDPSGTAPPRTRRAATFFDPAATILRSCDPDLLPWTAFTQSRQPPVAPSPASLVPAASKTDPGTPPPPPHREEDNGSRCVDPTACDPQGTQNALTETSHLHGQKKRCRPAPEKPAAPTPTTVLPLSDAAPCVAPSALGNLLMPPTKRESVRVARFIDTFVERIGVAFELYVPSGSSRGSSVPPRVVGDLIVGVLFIDGSCMLLDPVALAITYVNRHYHRLTVRAVTGKAIMPIQLERKLQAVLWCRAAFAYHAATASGKKATVALNYTVVECVPNTTGPLTYDNIVKMEPPPDMTSTSGDDLDYETQYRRLDDAARPIYVASALPLRATDASGTPCSVLPEEQRYFCISSHSVPYPNHVYYDSDDD